MVCHLHGKYFHSYPPDCDHLEMLVSIRNTLKEVFSRTCLQSYLQSWSDDDFLCISCFLLSAPPCCLSTILCLCCHSWCRPGSPAINVTLDYCNIVSLLSTTHPRQLENISFFLTNFQPHWLSNFEGNCLLLVSIPLSLTH